jgi:hypothetical protein
VKKAGSSKSSAVYAYQRKLAISQRRWLAKWRK